MTKREKYQHTYEAIISEIALLEKKFANRFIENSNKLGEVQFNTVDIHQDIGKLKVLREIIYR